MDSTSVINIIVNSVVGLGTLGLAFIAFYLEFLKKPNLKIIYRDCIPYKKLLHSIYDRDPYGYGLEIYIRVKITNKRRTYAKRCVAKILEWYTNGKKENSFDPCLMHWVSNSPEDYSPIQLGKDEYDYLDLVYTAHEQNQIRLYTSSVLKGSPTIFKQTDKHIFKLSVYCENCKPRTKWYKLTYIAKSGYFQKSDDSHKVEAPFWLSMRELSKKEIRKIISNSNIDLV